MTIAFLSPFLVVIVSLLVPIYPLSCVLAPFLVIFGNLYAKRQMKKLREEAFSCSICNNPMHIVPKSVSNNYLNASQNLEEKIKSVDYDVFLCDNCSNTVVYPYDKRSAYSQCPQCGTKALTTTKTVIQRATYASAGTQQISYQCVFCDYKRMKNKTLPRLQRASFSGGGIGDSGGFSGGHSSGGGSFGGGSSGGGGSTSHW
jgi:uncharacterized protein